MTHVREDSVRALVQTLNKSASLRELAGVLGVSHWSVFKLVQGRPLRPSTLRRIADGLAGSRDAVAFDELLEAFGTLLQPLSGAARRRLEQRLAEAVEEAFRSARQPVPGWVRWLSDGRRSAPSRKESLDALVRRVQVGSEGGARAISRRRG